MAIVLYLLGLSRILDRFLAQRSHELRDTDSRPEPYVDTAEAAAFLSIHRKTLMRLAREGKVPAYSISEGTRRHWRFLLSELDKWMKTKVNSSPHPVRPRPADGRRK
jgi:excisionase family DNA binding protein